MKKCNECCCLSPCGGSEVIMSQEDRQLRKKMKCKEKYEKTWSHKWNTWEQTEPYEDNLKSSALNSSCETKQKPVPISTAAHIAAWVSERISGEIQHGFRSWCWAAAILHWGVSANQLQHSWNAVIPVLCTNFVSIIVVPFLSSKSHVNFLCDQASYEGENSGKHF